MGGGNDHAETPPPVEKGFATLATIRWALNDSYSALVIEIADDNLG